MVFCLYRWGREKRLSSFIKSLRKYLTVCKSWVLWWYALFISAHERCFKLFFVLIKPRNVFVWFRLMEFIFNYMFLWQLEFPFNLFTPEFGTYLPLRLFLWLLLISGLHFGWVSFSFCYTKQLRGFYRNIRLFPWRRFMKAYLPLWPLW